ncbi:MAG: hypothetical protein JSS30_05005 [Verrucomicrobia bacterium]|nr:hypothetical protein [Verrucomicrobiota bacterium]
MIQIEDYRKEGTDSFFVAYDFEKVHNGAICDEIASDCQIMITATKILAVALVTLSLTTLAFTTVGVLSFTTGISLWSLAQIATLSLLADFAPVCFLAHGLQTLLETQNHYYGQISLAESRRVELLTK